MTTPRTGADQLAEHQRWRTAFEQLAEAVETACAFDAGETLPESAPWAAALDALDNALNAIRDTADAVSKPAAGAEQPQAEPVPHQVTVTHLPGGFDLADRRPFEQLIGNGVAGWVSHLPAHPAACHRLPYGQQCWFDDEWEHGQYTYDDVQPGLYTVTYVREDVGDHEGEYSHTEEYLDYQRIGDAPERTAAEPAPGYSEESPF